MKDISIDDLVVLDNEPPVITLTGDEVVTIEVGSLNLWLLVQFYMLLRLKNFEL